MADDADNFDPDKYLSDVGSAASPESLMNGTYPDTGRVASSPGERLDSVTGAPIRAAIGAMQQGDFSGAPAAAWQSFNADPQAHASPSGEQLVQATGITNPYLAKGLGMGLEAATNPLTWAGDIAPGVAGTVESTEAASALSPKAYKPPTKGPTFGNTGTKVIPSKSMPIGKVIMKADGGDVAPPEAAPADTSGFDPDSYIQDATQEKFGGALEQGKAFLEGAGKGVAGPLAPLFEKRILGVKDEAIAGREAANPITSGVGQAAGLAGSMMTGVGEGAIMGHIGQAAAEAAGLGGALKGASLGYKVGSGAVKQAAEMAVLQGSDEAAKQVINDPDASAQSAIANIGLASALGAGFGAAGGAVGKLWETTAGPKVEEFLSGLKSHLNGEGKLKLPEHLQGAFDDLGIEPHPVMRAALSGDEASLVRAQELYRAQNPEFMAHLDALPQQIREAVTNGLGIPLEDAAVFSEAEAGKNVRDKAAENIDERYGPLSEDLDAIDKEASTIEVPDEERLALRDRIMEKAVGPEVGTDAHAYPLYEKYGQRVLAKNNILGIDSIAIELYKLSKSPGVDNVNRAAMQNIRQMLQEFKEQQISKQAKSIGESMVDTGVLNHAANADAIKGVGSAATREAREAAAAAQSATTAGREEGKQLGAEVINRRADVKRNYAEYAKKMDALMDNLGLGEFKGTGNLKARLAELTPEQVIKKFSTKGDVESAKLLSEEFPEVSELVRQHEAKKFLAPSVHDVDGESSLDLKNLAKRLESLKKGSPEHAAWVLPPNADKNIQSAKMIQDAISKIKGIKDSGTPAGIGKIFKHFGSSALAGVGYLMGHNPIAGALIGEMAQRLGKNAPEAVKLGLLTFMGSEQPVKAGGFKAMVDFLHNTSKGESIINKGVTNILKPGAQVLGTHLVPDQNDRDKLDKIVSKASDRPEAILQQDQGHLGHYLPQHQVATAQATTQAVQYLQHLKPKPYQAGPMNRPIDPSPSQNARYNRALDIAQQPAIVLQRIKEGTLQQSDIQDLSAMYPALYRSMQQKLTSGLAQSLSEESQVPYHTRIAISLFLGQPLDTSMSPASIMAAQPKPQVPPQMAGSSGGSKKGNTKAIGKSNSLYQTAGQNAEKDRSTRD